MTAFLAFLLLFALSDSAALNKARQIWGEQARIGTVRGVFDSNWTKQVGFSSPQCANIFTVVGTGFNTWDAAFDNALLNPQTVHGPFKGLATLKAVAWDAVGITAFQFYIDGALKTPEIVLPVAPRWDVTSTLDTTTLANGLHVVCAQGKNVGGLLGKSTSILFKVDQAAAIAAVWPDPLPGGPALAWSAPPIVRVP